MRVSSRPEPAVEVPPRSVIAEALVCPFPLTLNPHLEAAQAHSDEWMRRMGLFPSERQAAAVAQARMAVMAAGFYPGASVEGLSLASDYLVWAFALDDAGDESSIGRHPSGLLEREDDLRSLMARFASYEEAMLGAPPRPDWTVFHTALRDLAERGEAMGGRAWRRRWSSNMARYFDGCVLELPHRQRGTVPRVSEYRLLRVWSVGTLACFDVQELALRRPLTDAEAAQPDLVRARELAALLTAWVNDVYSFPKEQAARDAMNLVAVLAREFDLSTAQAFDAAARVYNQDLSAFAAAARDARRAIDEEPIVGAYLEGLANWIHGNHAWTASCGRYAMNGHAAESVRRRTR